MTHMLISIEILLEEGVNTDAVTSLGYTPLMQACRSGNKEITAMLLERHANPEQVGILTIPFILSCWSLTSIV